MKTEENNYFNLTAAVEDLVSQIQNFESETFSASETNIDRATAEAMAAWMLRMDLLDLGIDGATVGLAWDNVEEARQAIVDSL